VSEPQLDLHAIRVPHVRVLLATYNGVPWLDEQLESIAVQQGVRVTVVASDDSSTDGTLEALARWTPRVPLEVLPPYPARFGSAHRNFLRLIRDAELGDADYFALSDQDDVWLPRKLLRGIECLNLQGAQGYSSNVTAFWRDGSQEVIQKAHPQRSLDYLFGSPGPGCTFILPRRFFQRVKAFVTQKFDELQAIWVHDWLVYAFVRSNGGRWFIDPQSNMMYRQHGHNEIGANAGLRAAINRLKLVRSGAYRRDILAIADSVCVQNDIVDSLRRLNLIDRIGLMFHVRKFRRRFSECLILAVFFLVMPRG